MPILPFIFMHIFSVKHCSYVGLSLTHTQTFLLKPAVLTPTTNSLTCITLTHFSISLLQAHAHSVEQYDIHKEIKMPAAHETSMQPWRRKRPQWQLCAPYSSSSSLPTINSELQQPCYKSLYHFSRSPGVFSRILPLILYSENPASARERGSPGLTPDKVLSF